MCSVTDRRPAIKANKRRVKEEDIAEKQTMREAELMAKQQEAELMRE